MESMMTGERPGRCLAELLEALKVTLPRLAGFRKLSIFGSVAEGRWDEHSDIDLIVTTDDLARAKAQALGLLEEIGPVEFAWSINLRPSEWNPIIVFRDEGYLHKLDLGLTDSAADDRTIPAEQTTLLVDQPLPCADVPGVSGAYVPEHGSVGHFLLGQLIGCARYVKTRRRGETLTSYRFVSATVEWRLALRYARLTGATSIRSRLSTDDYRRLDSLLSPGERKALVGSADLSAPTSMDVALLAAADGMHEDAAHVASASGETLRADVFERMLGWLRDELHSRQDGSDAVSRSRQAT